MSNISAPSKGGILKFVNQQSSPKRSGGIKCFPNELYGVSRQSPDSFQHKNALVSKKGYYFGHDAKQKNKSFEYYSQKHFLSLCPEEDNKIFSTHFHDSAKGNTIAFHRKKGRLSEFMDKNGWMNNVHTLMGDERNKTARNFSNKDRQSRITTKRQFLATTRKGFFPSREKKTEREKDFVKSLMLSEKQKIRKMRNDLATIQAERPPSKELYEVNGEKNEKLKTFTMKFRRLSKNT